MGPRRPLSLAAPALSLLASLLLLGAASPARAEDAQARAERLLQTLRSGDPAERIRAVAALEELGEAARPALERALGDPDPDVRLHVLYLLHAPEGELERRLRLIVEGRPHERGATYPLALQVAEQLLADGKPGLRDQLLHVVRRAAERGQARLAIVALELYEGALRRDPTGARVRDGVLLGELFRLELGDAAESLLDALGALPPDPRLSVLRGALAREEPAVLARAARALGEVASRAQAAEGRELLGPLLRHREAAVRREAIRAWGLLDGEVGAEPIARAILDADPEVSEEALRLAGERRVLLAREAAERVARDAGKAQRLRRQALRTLGLLGDPRSQDAVSALAKQREPRELSLTACWALGAMRAPDAVERLARRIESEEEADEPLLYYGLARAGGEAGRAALLRYLALQSAQPGSEAARALLYARQLRALDAMAVLRHPRAAQDLAEFVARQRRGGAAAERALEALERRGDAAAADALLGLLGDRRVAFGDPEWPTLARAVARVGAPGSQDLQAAVRELVRGLQNLPRPIRDPERAAGEAAAEALVRLDSARAREVLRRETWNRGLTFELRRAYARCLGRLGEPEGALRGVLQLSADNLRADGEGEKRSTLLNDVGIDQLYARRYPDALLTFRRVRWDEPNESYAAYNAACAEAYLGHPDDAVRLLRRAVRFKTKNPTLFGYDQDLRSLHGDPRFQSLVEQLRLARETDLPIPVAPLPR
ncbi:MAG: HEAT repeat domain-containing protein [Planctomycetota bacterium]